MIGGQRKELRLFYLKNYWMNKVKDVPGISLGTSLKPGFGCGIGFISVAGKKPVDVELFLWNNYRVHVSTIEWENIKGTRITPNVYTSTKQLDVLVEGLTAFAKQPA